MKINRVFAGWVIIRAEEFDAEFPHLQKAHRIARELSEQRLDEIIAGRIHLHRNPVKKPAKATAAGSVGNR